VILSRNHSYPFMWTVICISFYFPISCVYPYTECARDPRSGSYHTAIYRTARC